MATPIILAWSIWRRKTAFSSREYLHQCGTKPIGPHVRTSLLYFETPYLSYNKSRCPRAIFSACLLGVDHMAVTIEYAKMCPRISCAQSAMRESKSDIAARPLFTTRVCMFFLVIGSPHALWR